MIHVCTPYDIHKNLARAYNSAFRMIGEDEWLCVHDWDIQFLLPETIKHLHEYPQHFADAAVFTCFTNRSHVNSKMQLLGGVVSENTDILYHIDRAQEQTRHLYKATEIRQHISGFLMLISKKTWNEIPFEETYQYGGCLGIDTMFSQKLLAKGKKIYRMDGVYCFHQYRIVNGVKNKDHLL